MNSLKILKDEARVFLDSRIYPRRSIISAAHAFSGSCWVRVDKDNKDVIFVSLSPKEPDIEPDILGLEFFNYVLGMAEQDAD